MLQKSNIEVKKKTPEPDKPSNVSTYQFELKDDNNRPYYRSVTNGTEKQYREYWAQTRKNDDEIC
jgi:hypothetical protein